MCRDTTALPVSYGGLFEAKCRPCGCLLAWTRKERRCSTYRKLTGMRRVPPASEKYPSGDLLLRVDMHIYRTTRSGCEAKASDANPTVPRSTLLPERRYQGSGAYSSPFPAARDLQAGILLLKSLLSLRSYRPAVNSRVHEPAKFGFLAWARNPRFLPLSPQYSLHPPRH